MYVIMRMIELHAAKVCSPYEENEKIEVDYAERGMEREELK